MGTIDILTAFPTYHSLPTIVSPNMSRLRADLADWMKARNLTNHSVAYDMFRASRVPLQLVTPTDMNQNGIKDLPSGYLAFRAARPPSSSPPQTWKSWDRDTMLRNWTAWEQVPERSEDSPAALDTLREKVALFKATKNHPDMSSAYTAYRKAWFDVNQPARPPTTPSMLESNLDATIRTQGRLFQEKLDKYHAESLKKVEAFALAWAGRSKEITTRLSTLEVHTQQQLSRLTDVKAAAESTSANVKDAVAALQGSFVGRLEEVVRLLQPPLLLPPPEGFVPPPSPMVDLLQRLTELVDSQSSPRALVDMNTAIHALEDSLPSSGWMLRIESLLSGLQPQQRVDQLLETERRYQALTADSVVVVPSERFAELEELESRYKHSRQMLHDDEATEPEEEPQPPAPLMDTVADQVFRNTPDATAAIRWLQHTPRRIPYVQCIPHKLGFTEGRCSAECAHAFYSVSPVPHYLVVALDNALRRPGTLVTTRKRKELAELMVGVESTKRAAAVEKKRRG